MDMCPGWARVWPADSQPSFEASDVGLFPKKISDFSFYEGRKRRFFRRQDLVKGLVDLMKFERWVISQSSIFEKEELIGNKAMANEEDARRDSEE